MMVDLRGWLSVDNAILLRRLIDRHGVRSVLEIGTYFGLSTLLFATQDCDVTTIDPFKCGEETYLQVGKNRMTRQFEKLMGNLEAFGVHGRVEILPMTSDEAVELLQDCRYDMVYIDGSHEYDQVKRDIEHFLPLATKVICGDDYTKQWPGVKQAVDELLPDADKKQRLWFKEIQR